MQIADLASHFETDIFEDLIALERRGEARAYPAPATGEPMLWVVDTRYTMAEYAALSQHGTYEDGRYHLAAPRRFLAFLREHEQPLDTDPDQLECRNGAGWLVEYLTDHDGSPWTPCAGGMMPHSDHHKPIIPFSPFDRHIVAAITIPAVLMYGHALAYLHNHERIHAA